MLGSQMRRCDPQNGFGILNFFKKPLEIDRQDWDALELSGRQSVAVGMRDQARGYLVQLIDATRARDALRHARALRFHAEILHGGNRVDQSLARTQLETAITVLDEAEAPHPAAKTQERGFAHEMLAKVHISHGRFRLARTAIREARRCLGDTDRLNDLEDRATRRIRQASSNPPQPPDGAAEAKRDG